MDALQRYLFDLQGFIHVPDVLDPAHIATLLAEARRPRDDEPGWAPGDGRGAKLRGAQRMLHYHPCFRELLAQPVVHPIVEELCGAGFRLDHVSVHSREGAFDGGRLHGNHAFKPGGGNGFSQYRSGRLLNGLVSVAFELEDTHCNGGGFCCVPGSHKANVALPEKYVDLTGESIDSAVQRVPAAAGDIIVFTESLIHGTLPWRAPTSRTTLFYKWNVSGSAYSGEFFDPAEFMQYPDMDARKLAVLEPPNARYSGSSAVLEQSKAGARL